MTKEELYRGMQGIDDNVLESSEKKVRKHMRPWMKWAICACLILLVWQSGLYKLFVAKTAVGYSITVNGNVYFPASWSSLDLLEIPHHISFFDRKDQVGEKMGVVTASGSEELEELPVYHHAAYPDSDGICVVKDGFGYQVYALDYYATSEKKGMELPDSWEILGLPYQARLDALQMPDSILKIKATNRDYETTFLQDANNLKTFCELIGPCEQLSAEASKYGKEIIFLEIILKNGECLECRYYPETGWFVSMGYYMLPEAAQEEFEAMFVFP